MKTITIFYDNTWYTYSWLKMLFINKSIFLERGYRIVFKGPTFFIPKIEKIYKRLKTKTEFLKAFSDKYDIVFLAYHSPYGLAGLKADERKECLDVLGKNSNKIVWLDPADSAGSCYFDVLPFVDKYLKKQIYSNLELYTKQLYGDRIYTDYYHKVFCVSDENVFCNNKTLDKDFFSKIGLSWNIGLSDLFSYNKVLRLFQRNQLQTIHLTPSDTLRVFDIHYRCTFQNGIYGYQRKELYKILTTCRIKTVDYSKNPHGKKYRKEMALSNYVISPFGYGEICIRDFEAMFSGAILLKPDMSHLTTYPNWFIPYKTYLPLPWDFNGLNKTFEELPDYKKVYYHVAKEAQDLFHKYRTCYKFKEEFVDHLLKEIE